ncbi:TetR/AcrR family transcriptional regulator [Nonomuraea sp. NPDC050790]|uniref:TetR/AcrR family transcriptional regulator n=1 Tax=Nonomuraea sp. NPDC050790 TaxID=3364371 RepID=UPI0037B36BAD
MDTEPGLRARKKLRTRNELTEAALRLFAGQGYEATTVGQIAAAANVSRATFFNYFTDKEDVIFADNEAHEGLLREFLSAADRPPTPREALLQAVERMLAAPVWSVDPGSDLVLVRARLIAAEPALRARALLRVADLHSAWALALRAAYPEELDEIAAAALCGAVIGAVLGAAASHLKSGGEAAALPGVVRRAAGRFA